MAQNTQIEKGSLVKCISHKDCATLKELSIFSEIDSDCYFRPFVKVEEIIGNKMLLERKGEYIPDAYYNKACFLTKEDYFEQMRLPPCGRKTDENSYFIFLKEEYPLYVHLLMNEQERQGNVRDFTVFQEDSYAPDFEGGFDWAKTNSNYYFWSSLLHDEPFLKWLRELTTFNEEPFFKHYKTDSIIKPRKGLYR